MYGAYKYINFLVQYPIHRFFLPLAIMHLCFVNNTRDDKYLRDFGKHLRQLRLKKDLTQEILSEEAGIGKNQVGLIERGEINVTISTIKRLAKSLGVAPKELLNF